jgi:hypothetical protein
MASDEQLKEAIGCLSQVYPQYTQKVISELTDQITSIVQGFTDPLAALADAAEEGLSEAAKQISDVEDTFNNLESVASGLLTQYVNREAKGFLESASKEIESVSKRSQGIRNMAGALVTGASQLIALVPDMPYIAAQRLCASMVRLIDIKVENLRCLKKHITQLTNCILLLAENTDNYKADLEDDIQIALGHLADCEFELTRSQRIDSSTKEVIFDTSAFSRARAKMHQVVAVLSPEQQGDNILAEGGLLTSGSLGATLITNENRSLVTMAIRPLILLIESEAAGIEAQVSVINYHVASIVAVVTQFQDCANASQVKAMRERAIADITQRVASLSDSMISSSGRSSTTSMEGQMLEWVSRARSVVASMDSVKETSFKEGSVDGPDRAYALELAFQTLSGDLLALGSPQYPVVEEGIEDTTALVTQTRALAKGARRVLDDLEKGSTDKNKMATFHALAQQVAVAQLNSIDQSVGLAENQRTICGVYLEIDFTGPALNKYEGILDSMRQLGLDRGADMLSTGRFSDLLSTDLAELSYLGTGIECLRQALDGVDDTQTRQQISDLRDDMVAAQTNQDVAAADSADQGRSRILDQVRVQISEIQRSQKTVESIVSRLEELAGAQGVDISIDLVDTPAFLGNLDFLEVGAGGRLSGFLEEAAEFPNTGVVRCE